MNTRLSISSVFVVTTSFVDGLYANGVICRLSVLIGLMYNPGADVNTVPPYAKCPSCELWNSCTPYPSTNISNANGSVCTKCVGNNNYEKTYLDDYNMPVFARSIARPRQCKNLL